MNKLRSFAALLVVLMCLSTFALAQNQNNCTFEVKSPGFLIAGFPNSPLADAAPQNVYLGYFPFDFTVKTHEGPHVNQRVLRVLSVDWWDSPTEKLRAHYVALQISLGVNRPDSTISGCALATPLVNFGLNVADVAVVAAAVGASNPTLGDLLNTTSAALRPNANSNVSGLLEVYLKLEQAAKPIIFNN